MAKIFIIAGHGAGDPGACGNNYTEAERVRALTARIKHFGGSNVMVGDTNRNWYADKGINTLTISKEYQILELHMDSGPSSARGGHVIIHGKYKADTYDTALAKFISTILPGRSSSLVGRTDLANVNRAAAKGYGYRLMECGFISNSADVSIFNTKMDEIAKGILAAFGITSTTTTTKKDTSKTTTTTTTTKKDTSKTTTTTAKKDTLSVDGKWGVATTTKAQKVFKTTVDGVISYQPKANKVYLPNAYTTSWKFYVTGYEKGSSLIRAIQKWCGLTGNAVDGFFGPASVKAFQKKLSSLKYYTGKIDGAMGPATVKAFQTYLNTK